MKVAVVGATGQVGTVMRRLLAARSFPIDDIRFMASSRSAGSPRFSASAVAIEILPSRDALKVAAWIAAAAPLGVILSLGLVHENRVRTAIRISQERRQRY